MISVLIGISCLFVISFSFNVFFLLRTRKKQQRPMSIEAEELLSDLTAGAALVRITPIDPRHVFFRGVKK